MSALRLTTLILLLAPLACGDDTSTTTEGSSSSSSSTTETPTSTTSSDTGGIVTSTDPMSTGTSGDTDSTTGGTDTEGDTSTGADLCAGDKPRIMLVTSLGDMVVELDAVNAPKTVANFIEYVEAGFYDGTIFHRVIPGFVLQGGGFTPGLVEKPANSPIALETSPKLTHVDGAIAMARTDDVDSATSQFYICDGPQPGLDGEYAVFGVLVSGLEVRDAIAMVATQNQGDDMDVPVEDVVIEMAYCVATL